MQINLTRNTVTFKSRPKKSEIDPETLQEIKNYIKLKDDLVPLSERFLEFAKKTNQDEVKMHEYINGIEKVDAKTPYKTNVRKLVIDIFKDGPTRAMTFAQAIKAGAPKSVVLRLIELTGNLYKDNLDGFQRILEEKKMHKLLEKAELVEFAYAVIAKMKR